MLITIIFTRSRSKFEFSFFLKNLDHVLEHRIINMILMSIRTK